MVIRPKLFLLIFVITVASLLLLCGLNYWQDTASLESQQRLSLRRDADWIALRLNAALGEHEDRLVTLARNSALREYLSRRPTPSPSPGDLRSQKLANHKPEPTAATGLSGNLSAAFAAFFLDHQKDYSSLACLNIEGEPVFRALMMPTSPPNKPETTVVLQTQNLISGNSGFDSIGGDLRFKTAKDGRVMRALIDRGPSGPTIQYTVPVISDGPAEVLGALVTDLKPDWLFKQHASDVVGALNGMPTGLQSRRVVLVLHRTGKIFSHSNGPVSYQPVESSMPEFKSVAEAMVAGESGAKFYQDSDQDRWLASYVPLNQFDLSVAVATDYSWALAPVRRELLRNILFSLALALLAAVPLTLIAQRRSGRSLERLTQDTAAIAHGHLDQQLVVSSAENQPLADSVNVITKRLREQLAREAESRQFDSFLRLSAMLTHDLKNTITALSLGVSNMERNFARADFRADAMDGLKDATAKLQKLVSKLSEPVNTMSGEHQVPRATDLTSMIQRVLSSLTPTTPIHQIELQLREPLTAVVEPDRMEKVVENLVINSLEAMGETKGTLTITGGSAGDRQVFFSVSDTGPGMSKDFQERRLFHPFATTKRGGVGLGLYTCREVVRAHGGTIDVTSEVGVGTTFRVVLPSVYPGE